MIHLHYASVLLWTAKIVLHASNLIAPYLFSKVENILDRFHKEEKSIAVNEIIDHQHKVVHMDKQIKKVKKDVKKTEKDTNSLLKLDKAHDKKMAKCDKLMKKKKS